MDASNHDSPLGITLAFNATYGHTENTAFVMPDGLFEFKLMPFGLSTSGIPSCEGGGASRFQWQSSLVYLGDVVVFLSDFDEHSKRHQTVFKTAGLTLEQAKCRFTYGKLRFLGHVLSNEKLGDT